MPRARPRGAPAQLVLGHLDTVWPLGSLATMPFAVHGDRVSGAGCFDMKAGLVQALYALAALRTLGRALPATPLLFVSSDEEIGGPSSRHWICRLARAAARAFVLEPAYGPHGAL
jgi:glutamate carboxypeptidase